MFSRKIGIVCAVLTVIIITAVFFLNQYHENKRLNAASYAVNVALNALQSKNVEDFNKHVNSKSLSESILSQVFEEPSEDEKSDKTGFWGAVKTLGSSLSNRLTGYIKPELAKSLNIQILTYVENGAFTEEYDLTNIYGRTPMLQKIWHDLAGEGFIFKGISDSVEKENTATSNINFYRKDLDFSSSITLNLTKTQDVWQVVGIEGLGKTLKQLDQLRVKIIEAKNKEIRAKINKSMAIRSIEKSTGVSEGEFGGKRVLLRVVFENMGEQDIKEFNANIIFKNKKGDLLRSVSIKDSDVLAAGNITEKSWPMTINPLSQNDNIIFDAKAVDLIMESEILSITLKSGEKLEYTQQQK